MSELTETYWIDRKLLGAVVHQARLDMEMTLQELGAASGMSHSHVLRVEAGDIDISLEKFFRLSLALGFPSGLLVQGAIRVKQATFKDAAMRCPTVDIWARSKNGNHQNRKELMADFIAGSAATMVFLVLSPHAKDTVKRIQYPVKGQMALFETFANSTDEFLLHSDRLSVLRKTLTDPTSELRFFSLISQEWAEEYFALASSGLDQVFLEWFKDYESPMKLPWVPDPNFPFVHLIGHSKQDLMPQHSRIDQKSNDPHLSDINLWDNYSSVPLTLPDLLARLNRVTSVHGKKSALASHMGVALPTISVWLSGKKEPSGGTTLRLLEWVQAEEAQQKSPASVRAPAEQRTRSRKSLHEKPKPSPPE